MAAGNTFLVGLGTQSSDVDPNQPPQQQAPANNAQNAGPVKAGLRGVLARMLGSFSYGAGQSMLKAAGDETDAERATRLAGLAHLNAQTQLLNQQAQMTPVQPYGPQGPTIYMPAAAAGPLLKQILANQGGVQKTLAGKRFIATPQGLYDTQTPDPSTGYPTLIPNSGNGLQITPEIQQDYDLPKESIGKFAKLTDLAAAQRGNASQFGFVMGANGPARESKVGPTGSLGLGNPGAATAAARASMTPVTIPDKDNPGSFKTVSALDAIKSGATTVTKPNGQQVMAKQALIDDIKGGISQLKASAGILDNPGSRFKIAAALGQPGLTTQTFFQSPILGSMSPAEQQYAIQALSLKEQAMAMRSVLGAGQGSEDLRRAIQATIPNASTPNSQYAIRQLDQFGTTLDRLSKGVPKLSSGTPPKATPAALPQGNSSDPFAAFGGKKR